ncbi:uncharacterized protein KGF55_002080 [Candida pseudojiufengensis]|uniref:uncharacterized protein n=1 Tax=Candida pseudojiufengensis TaxID=497109 RepID=UPI002224D01B|nr:uncharacterized protein KGF55_002080 [Candida pseudojiufengensis]KAI5964138.1 hypothetical protein KGF55_002080 [Candida pseudojiufengensis]
MVSNSSKIIISCIIRILQLTFAAAQFGLGLDVVIYLGYAKKESTYNFVIGIVTIVYLISIFILSFTKKVRILGIIIAESIIWSSNVAGFALIASSPMKNCSGYDIAYPGYYDICQKYQAILPMGVLNAVLFATNLVILHIYAERNCKKGIPTTKSANYLTGIIFPNDEDIIRDKHFEDEESRVCGSRQKQHDNKTKISESSNRENKFHEKYSSSSTL